MDQERENQITHDLYRHAASEVEALLNRHMKIAQNVLPPAAVAMVLIQLASSTSLGAALYALQLGRDDKTPEQIWALTISSIAKLTDAGKQITFDRLAAFGKVA